MEWIVLAISLTTLLYVPVVAVRASQLKRMPRPYPAGWLKQYVRALERIRTSLWTSFFILGSNALIFFIPSFMGGAQGHLAAIFGGLDLLCALVLYGVYHWAGWLRVRAGK
ncbi:MAG TPA: hypothetical protein VFN35_04800 [Ktedonobacteraceae bacterium]|nr:hypothetical protein [Ktedonobacteraceae bacterium]